jgi:hypothetical protein
LIDAETSPYPDEAAFFFLCAKQELAVASNWNAAVAHQSLGESTLRKNVLPIKGDDTHRWLHSPARILIQHVADAELLRA